MNKIVSALRKILPVRYCGAVIVAAGKSTRMEGVDKIFAPLGGEPLIVSSIKAFENCSRLSEITMPDSLVTVAPDAFDRCKNIQTINASNEWKQKHHDLVVSIVQNRLK